MMLHEAGIHFRSWDCLPTTTALLLQERHQYAEPGGISSSGLDKFLTAADQC